jgi:hypothetical protein
LRKIAAFVSCTFLVLTLGFMFIHPVFLMLANWLGPVLGTSLLTALSMLYLLLGDPLKFVALAALWGSAALLGGIIIRRRVGAVLTMLLIFAMLIPVLAASVYDMAMIVSDLTETIGEGHPMDFLPPLPIGLTLAHLYDAPIIGSLMESAIGMFQAGGPPSNIQRLFYTMLTPILIGVAEKLVIIVFASLIGVEIGKLIEPSLRPTSESIRVSLGGKLRGGREEITTLKENMRTLGIVLMIITSSLMAAPYALAEGDEDFYSENIMGYADSRGRSYVGDLFIESGTQLEGVATEGLLVGVILSQEGVREILPELMGMDMEGFESFANMIPPTVMVTVYVDVPPEIAGQRSVDVSQAFSSAYGVDLQQLMALEPPIPIGDEMELPPISMVLYQSSGDLGDLSETYLDQFLDNGGLAELIEEASTNGRLVPGASPDSADGSVLLSGFVNIDLILEYMPEDVMENVTAFIPEEITGLLGFAGGVSYWDRGVESEEEGLDLLGLLGVEDEEDAGFSDDSDMSLILLAAPNGTDIGGETGAPNVKITTSLPLDDPKIEFIYEMLTDLGLLTMTAPGESLDPSSFHIPLSGVTLPLNVEVSKSFSTQIASPDDVVEVTVTVRNHDTEAMKDVSLDDTSSLQGYSLSTRLVSGSTSEHWSEIGPGQSRSMSYTVELGQGGAYSLSPANVTYTHEELGFSDSSDWAEVSVSQPSALTMGIGSILNTGETLAEILDMATGGNGGTILMGATAIVVLILAVLEFLNFKKWIGGQ